MRQFYRDVLAVNDNGEITDLLYLMLLIKRLILIKELTGQTGKNGTKMLK